MIRARVSILPKRTVFDPQGEAVRHALGHFGLSGVERVRVGKEIELEIPGEGDPAEIRSRLETIARDFLANPVVEEYELHIEGLP
ncbi:Phosphoribosylformylglycinamidine synthase subunit PurS [Methylacidimicrobium cyclopophantes]|uniref:Phosphoribosylformylglycinamidine synthase subunit PurS n=1 Tax=Methylacidimicrobium cyclopophantes TaxID=1041766 RepID=A0A5E6M9Z1_9BACT|nr:phosphoribosylformylglycinamidine synthase subunit PurS [Methylacidimicrobium cyclopophantes]VVM06362.1 Phosphoribosylformylglycinamidine synthase subunit PurS [Methylacidimicrobium cyclopophantes]